MIIGTTPTLTLKLKKIYNIDFRTVNDIYVTLQQSTTRITKTGTDIVVVDSKTLQVSITETESLSFAADKSVQLQVNWTYTDHGTTKRAATKIILIDLEKQLLKDAIT